MVQNSSENNLKVLSKQTKLHPLDIWQRPAPPSWSIGSCMVSAVSYRYFRLLNELNPLNALPPKPWAPKNGLLPNSLKPDCWLACALPSDFRNWSFLCTASTNSWLLFSLSSAALSTSSLPACQYNNMKLTTIGKWWAGAYNLKITI